MLNGKKAEKVEKLQNTLYLFLTIVYAIDKPFFLLQLLRLQTYVKLKILLLILNDKINIFCKCL